MKPRLVKSQREMEGRFEDVWVLVDEDDEVETWPEDVELDVVGKPATRLDGPVRASGAARFTVDVTLPGMLHALVLRAPVARARVTALDLESARATPGVRAVVGPGDPTVMGGDPVLTEEPGWAGAPIAAVAADTPEAAVAGLATLAPAYETLAPLDVEAGLEEQRFTEEPRETVRGDPDAGLAAADARVELTCETPAHVQSPLEPHAAVARWDGDSLTAWVSTQGMFDARQELCRRFGLPPEQVRVISEFIGGGFGAKQGAGVEALLAAELARATGRPVRLALGRHEEQVVGGRRAWTRQTVTLGARRDGTLHGDRARRGRRDGRRWLDLPGRGAGPLHLRVPERPRDGLPRPNEPPRPERLPRPRRRRGRHRARAGDGRARECARDGPAGASPA